MSDTTPMDTFVTSETCVFRRNHHPQPTDSGAAQNDPKSLRNTPLTLGECISMRPIFIFKGPPLEDDPETFLRKRPETTYTPTYNLKRCGVEYGMMPTST